LREQAHHSDLGDRKAGSGPNEEMLNVQPMLRASRREIEDYAEEYGS